MGSSERAGSEGFGYWVDHTRKGATCYDAGPMATLLDVTNLRVTLDGEPILAELSFEVEEGETLVILGPNGAGKTVLLKALLGLVEHAGTITWREGVKIGYVPQRVTLEKNTPITVADFFSLKRVDAERATEMLRQVDLGDPAILEKSIAKISSGQFQRVLIAWALANDPEVLLFDEPTTGIDVGGQDTIYSLLDKTQEARNLTILLVTHELEIVSGHADKALCLNKKMFCYGSPTSILTPERLQEIYGQPARFSTTVTMSEMLLPMLVVGLVVGGAAGYVGSLMVSYRMALVGDALGHIALPGIGLALVWQLDTSLGALAALLVGILLIWRLRETTLLPFDTLVGIVFVTSLALGFLIVPEPELLESLIGDITTITWLGAGIAALACALVFVVLARIHSGMMLLNISEELAIVQGISPARYNLVYLLVIAGLVALGVKIVGTLLVGALVIIPAASARLVTRNLRQYVRVSIVLGSASCVGGTALFELTGFPAGPSIILINAVVFVVALLAQQFTGSGAAAASPE